MPDRRPWIRAALLAGAAYLVVGEAFAAFAGWASSQEMRHFWRWAAWVASAAVFAAHLWYEHVRLHSSAARTARHTAIAVALGGFLLAAWAFLHAQMRLTGHLAGHIVALVVWPLVTGAPAFVVALVAASLLARARRSA